MIEKIFRQILSPCFLEGWIWGVFGAGRAVIRGDLSQILAVRFSRLTAAPFFHFQRFRTGRAGRGTDTADGAPGFGHWR